MQENLKKNFASLNLEDFENTVDDKIVVYEVPAEFNQKFVLDDSKFNLISNSMSKSIWENIKSLHLLSIFITFLMI